MENDSQQTSRQQGPGLGLGDGLVLAASALLLSGFVMLPEPQAASMPDFASMDVQTKKQQFFAYLSPIIARVNDELAEDRARLERILAEHEGGQRISWFDQRWLAGLAEQHEVELEESQLGEALATLRRRVGIVPEAIVLAQAAKESGWGTSRFAVEGNNLFGQRCYRQGCGIVPKQRAEGARFGVAEFDSVAESVESYVLNLNTHHTYQPFREQRLKLREQGRPLTALELIDGLVDYSERGEQYLAELRALIRQNGLE